jgi:hypothetical protein
MDMMTDTRKATDFIQDWMQRENLTDASAARLARTDRGFIRDLRLGKPPRKTRRREMARQDMRYLRLARLMGAEAEAFLTRVEKEQESNDSAPQQPIQIDLPKGPEGGKALDPDLLADAIWTELMKRDRPPPGIAYGQLRKVLKDSWERPAAVVEQVDQYIRGGATSSPTEGNVLRAVGWYKTDSGSPAWTQFWEECARVAFGVTELGDDRRDWVELFYLVARLQPEELDPALLPPPHPAPPAERPPMHAD